MAALEIRKDRTPTVLRKLAKAEAATRVARRILAIVNALDARCSAAPSRATSAGPCLPTGLPPPGSCRMGSTASPTAGAGLCDKRFTFAYIFAAVEPGGDVECQNRRAR